MIQYRESLKEKTFYDKDMHCNYCGNSLATPQNYCSSECKKKDSVWHKEDDT